MWLGVRGVYGTVFMEPPPALLRDIVVSLAMFVGAIAVFRSFGDMLAF